MVRGQGQSSLSSVQFSTCAVVVATGDVAVSGWIQATGDTPQLMSGCDGALPSAGEGESGSGDDVRSSGDAGVAPTGAGLGSPFPGVGFGPRSVFELDGSFLFVRSASLSLMPSSSVSADFIVLDVARTLDVQGTVASKLLWRGPLPPGRHRPRIRVACGGAGASDGNAKTKRRVGSGSLPPRGDDGHA